MSENKKNSPLKRMMKFYVLPVDCPARLSVERIVLLSGSMVTVVLWQKNKSMALP